MNYKEFIRIFKKDYNLDYFYIYFFKKKKKVEKILKEDVDDNFFKFLLKNKIEEEEEIKVFFKLYNSNIDINSVYLYYKNESIDLEDLKKIKDFDSLKNIILNKYKDYLKVDIDEIDKVDFSNILFFIIKHPNFYKKMNGNRYLNHIDLDNLNIERDLSFLKMLGIEEVEWDLNCNSNKNLKNLRGCPSYVGGSFYCEFCGLEELNMPKGVKIEKDFNCNFNKKLRTLKGSPSWIGGNFYCSWCGLEELGMQEGVKIERGNFICNDNSYLKTLKGCPSWVGGNFFCNGCNLDEINLDAGIIIKKDLICLGG